MWQLGISRDLPEKHCILVRILGIVLWGFPGSSDGKESACNAGDLGSVPGLGREEMTTHSSILAWRVPWTEQPGGL